MRVLAIGHHGGVSGQGSDVELVLAARGRLEDGVELGQVVAWLIDENPDLHPILMVKILTDASGENHVLIKDLVNQRLPPPKRAEAEALWEAAEMIWSGQMDVIGADPGFEPAGPEA